MEAALFIILIIVLPMALFAIFDFIRSARRKRLEKEMAEKLGLLLDEALMTINATHIKTIKKQLKVLKDDFKRCSVILEDSQGSSLNICPKCGDTLTIKDTAWHGRIIGCPNYPNCRYFKKVDEIKSGTFYELNIKDFH